MKIRTFITYILPLILVLTLAILVLVSGLLGKPLFTLPSLGIVKEKKTASSELLLEEIRKLKILHTLEYVHKTVFPYDFLDPRVSYEGILRKLRTGTGSVASLLSPTEQEYLAARNLAVRLGFGVGGEAAEFVVVTVIVRAGIDLGAAALETGKKQKTIRAALPRPQIIDVILEDSKPENYPYPDIKLNPAAWREIAEFIEGRIRPKILAEGVLDTAAANGREFLRAFFLQCGFTTVEILEAAR